MIFHAKVGKGGINSVDRYDPLCHSGIIWATITIHTNHAPMDFFGVCTFLSEELDACSVLNILNFYFCRRVYVFKQKVRAKMYVLTERLL